MIKHRSIFIATILSFVFPATALGYVGPGAGLGMLGALWGLLAAIATALVFILLWPIRRMLRRRAHEPAGDEQNAPASGEPAGGESTSRTSDSIGH